MRILLVAASAEPALLGSPHEYAVEMAVGLRRKGHDVHLFTSLSGEGRTLAELARWEVRGVPTIGVAVASSGDSQGGFSNPPVAIRFAQVAEVVRPDVVIFHSIRGMGIEQVEAALEMGLPTIAWLPDAWWLCERQFMIRSSGQWCGQEAIDPRVCSTCVRHAVRHEERQGRSRTVLNRCARILVPSSHWKRVVTKSGIREEIVHVLSVGVPVAPSALPRSPSPGPLRFGFAGSRSPEFGHQHLVEAFRRIVRSDYELHVANHPDGNRILTASDFPIAGYVKVVPMFAAEDAEQFLRGIDAMLCPTHWPESSGLAARQAIWAGVWPVVGAGAAGTEAVQSGVNGSIVPLDGSTWPLANALNWILDNSERVRRGAEFTEAVSFEDQVSMLEMNLREALGSARIT